MNEGQPKQEIYKSEGQLERQRRLANFDDEHKPLPSKEVEVPKLLQGLTPEEFVSKIRQIETERKEVDPPRRASMYPERLLLAHESNLSDEELQWRENERAYIAYSEYWNRLRALRERQREHIEQELARASSVESRREVLLRATSWAEPLQQKILEDLPNTNNPFPRRALADSRITEAAQTEEGFLSAIKEAASIAPDQVLNALPSLVTILGKEEASELVHAIALSRSASYILHHEYSIRTALGDELYLNYFCEAVEHGGRSPIFLDTLTSNTRLQEELGQEELKRLVAAQLERSPEFVVEINEDFWKKNLIDDATLSGVFAATVDTQDRSDRMAIFKTLLPRVRNSGKEMIRDAARSTLEHDPFYSFKVRHYEGLVDDDVLKDKVRYLLFERKDSIYISKLSDVERFLTPEEFKVWTREVLRRERKNIHLHSLEQLQVVESGLFDPLESKSILERLRREYPSLLFEEPDILLKDVPSESRGEVLASHVDGVPNEVSFGRLSEWLPHVGKTKEEQRAAVIRLCAQEGDLTFFKLYTSAEDDSDSAQLLKKLLSKDDVYSMLLTQSELYPYTIYFDLENIRSFVGGDNELKKFIDRARERDAYTFFNNFRKVVYLYEGEELVELIEKHIDDERVSGEILNSLDAWGGKLDKERLRSIVHAHEGIISLNPKAIMEVSKIFPEFTVEYFFKIFTKRNPPASLISSLDGFGTEYKKAGFQETPENIRGTALADTDTVALSPKRIQEFWKQTIGFDTQDRQRISHTVKNALYMYLHLDRVRQHGYAPVLLNIINQEQPDSKGESELLNLFITYIRCEELGLGDINAHAWKSREDVKQALFRGMQTMLGDEHVLTLEEQNRFFETFASPGPFMSYLSQYYKHPAHKKILSEMFESVVRGECAEWKYGKREEFEKFKERGWIPKMLTEDQYETWKRPNTTSLFESFETSGQDVVEKIQRLLHENVIHLGTHIFDTDLGYSEHLLEGVKVELKQAGQELEAINKEMSTLKKHTGNTEDVRIRELSEQKKQMQSVIKGLQQSRLLARLVVLTPKELASGYLYEGDKKVQKLDVFLHEILEKTQPGGEFVINQIIDLVDNFRTQGAEKENVTSEDTDDFKIMLEIGENPVESCQHYERGSYNSCLLGYSEPNTKIIIVRNSKGIIIARSILRLLSTNQGQPALHVERIYTPTASKGAIRVVLEHAHKKATALGVQLMTSMGEELEDIGFTQHIDETLQLHSRGARAPNVYVDSSSGAQVGGKYTIRDPGIIERAPNAAV